MKNKLKKLLVVDDDEDILVIVRYSFAELQNVEVRYASTGEQAIQEALSFQPDMILLDVMMPKMDGIMTLNALKFFPSLANIPVVFFTAKVQKEELNNYSKLGIIDVIIKPFDPLLLADNVLQIWDRYQDKSS